MGERDNYGNRNHSRAVEDQHPHATIYDLFILILTVLSLLVVLGLLILPLSTDTAAIFLRVDFLFCALFLVDFVISLWRAPSKFDYFFKQGGWLDLLGTIPTVPGSLWTGLFRLARLNRSVRIIKDLQGKDRQEMVASARKEPAETLLLATIFLAIIFVIFASFFILRFERGAAGASINAGDVAFWWTFVTITTVGYGDYVPVTFPGRILAIGLMIFGILIFAVLTSFVTSRIVVSWDDREKSVIKAELAEIKKLLRQGGENDDSEI